MSEPTMPTVQGLLDDMTLTAEGRPHGVPDAWKWSKGPVIVLGLNTAGYSRVTAWGQVYEALEGNPAVNTGVEIKELRLYLLSKSTGQWTIAQADNAIAGAAFLEAFGGNKKATIFATPDGGQAVQPGNGYNFHFWPAGGSVPMNPGDVGGVIVTCRARLVTVDPSLPDDRDVARYVLNVGADYKVAIGASSPGVGMGRFKFVSKDWRAFTFNVSAQSLWAAIPPI